MKHLSTSTKIVTVPLLAVFLTAGSLWADAGALTAELRDKIRSSFEMNPQTRANYNAITNNDIRNLVLNREVLRHHNEIFSHKIKTKGITNQKSSGRCWLFAGLNVMRPAVIEKYNLGKFEFSQIYLTFWDKLEKANRFLEYMIEFRDRELRDRELDTLLLDPFPDGGYWENAANLIGKYGVVPKEIMPETNSSENTSVMNRVISRKLRADAAKLRRLYHGGKSMTELRTAKEEMLSVIYRMLVLNFGEPPGKFYWRYEDKDSVISEMRTYTPQSFYAEYVGVDLSRFVNVFNDPTREYGRHYQIKLSRSMSDGDDIHYANVKMALLKDMALKSVLNDDPVLFACDVGKDQSRRHGIMALDLNDFGSIYDTDLSMTKADQALYREIVRSHGMVLVGVDMQGDRTVKWLVENSWGKDKGSEGHWTLYDEWFDIYVYNIIVKKEHVPEEILRIYEQVPVILPPWDPML